MGHVLDKPRSWVLAHADDSLSDASQERFHELVLRRSKGEPVGYLRGWVEWRDMELEVTPDVLIPRSETELLVDKAIEVASEVSADVLVDVGTGSGAIAIALAKGMPGAEVFAIDQSEAALRVANRNARKQCVTQRVRFLQGDLLEPLATKPDLLIGNLPYLSAEMMNALDLEVRHEPEHALRAGSTGLEVYAALFGQMRERDWRLPLVLEIDPRQRPLIGEVVEEWLTGALVEIYQDYAGLDRVVVVTL